MSAIHSKHGVFIVRSECAGAGFRAETAATDLEACMAQVGEVLRSGREVYSIEYAGKRIDRALLEAMVRLVAHRTMLEGLAISFGLDSPEADSSFGHLLIQDALVVQSFLEGVLAPKPIGRQSGTTCSSARAAMVSAKAAAPQPAVVGEAPFAPDSILVDGKLTRTESAHRV